MTWTPARRAEAASAVAEHGASAAAARLLSERWGERVTADMLSSALRRGAVRTGSVAADAPSSADAPSAAPARATAADEVAAVLAERARPAAAPPPTNALVAILSDLHIPEHDSAAVECALQWIERERPGIVVLAGDVGEWESCSQHGTSASAPTFRADLDAVEQFLRRLRKIAPDARLSMLEGNHETRLSRLLCSQAPTLHGAVSIPVLLGLDALGIEWVPEDRQPLAIGSLRIIHGHQMLRGSGPVYVAAKAVNAYGAPGTTVVVAHTHKRQQFRRAMADGHAEACAVPCLRTLSAGWLHGEVSGWTHGFAVATLREGRRTALEVVDIERGECVWGGRVYGAAARAA